MIHAGPDKLVWPRQWYCGIDAQARPSVPVGIDYETPLPKGAWKFSYRYQHIRGGDTRDATKLPSGVTQVPVELDTDLHTLGIEHAFFERLTLALQLRH